MRQILNELAIPAEVLAEFYPAGVAEAVRLDGGKVNTTFRITDDNGKQSVLQEMGKYTDPAASYDYVVVADHLEREGWEMARPLSTKSEDLVVTDDSGGKWRGYNFLESDHRPPPNDMATYSAFANMVGRLTLGLDRLDNFNPEHSIPYFHDAAHIIERVQCVMSEMAPSDREFSMALIQGIDDETPIEPGDAVIHGDPKLTNALFRDGKPFTMIDWDTLMKGSPLLDLADMLRSVAGKLSDTPGASVPDAVIHLIEQYQRAAEIPEADYPEHTEAAFSATRVMCFMLGLRYMLDTVDSSYFDWDSSLYLSAADHNRVRAQKQLKTALALPK